MRSILALSLTLFASSTALAHELWIERAGDRLALRAGHRGAARRPIDAAKVAALRCLDRGGEAKDLRAEATFAPTEVSVPARCDVLSATVENGFFCLTPDGTVHQPKTEVAQAVKSWQSRQFAKWVAPGEPAAPVGDELELVPLSDLSRAKPGEKVGVRVLLRGKPVAGATLSAHHRAVGQTDGNGEARVTIRGRKVETLTATLKRPLGAPEADTLVLEASLTFEAAP